LFFFFLLSCYYSRGVLPACEWMSRVEAAGGGGERSEEMQASGEEEEEKREIAVEIQRVTQAFARGG